MGPAKMNINYVDNHTLSKWKLFHLYIAAYMVEPEKHALQSQKWQLIGNRQWCYGAMRPSAARTNGHWTCSCSQQAHHRPNQPHQAFTLVSIHQMSPLQARWQNPITAYYSFIDLERMKG